jgi:threonine/homoserine/homoserine lactone efflux protein
MNIKLKAWLITLAIPISVAILTVLIARFPLVILLVLVGGALYCLYSGILNYLEYKDRWKQ